MTDVKEWLEALKAGLPDIVFRTDPKLMEITGLTPAYLANLDSLGRGIKNRIKVGKKVAYFKDDVIEFLAARVQEAGQVVQEIIQQKQKEEEDENRPT